MVNLISLTMMIMITLYLASLWARPGPWGNEEVRSKKGQAELG